MALHQGQILLSPHFLVRMPCAQVLNHPTKNTQRRQDSGTKEVTPDSSVNDLIFPPRTQGMPENPSLLLL